MASGSEPKSASSRKRKIEVELPSGGSMTVKSVAEQKMWQDSAKRYIADYALVKQNDLVLLGAILSQQLVMYRAQLDLNDTKKATNAQARVIKSSGEIRALEKALGIDKVSREAGGQHTVADYLAKVKRAARKMGVHLSERVVAYEKLAMDSRWRIRLLRNGDDEDRREHGISEKNIIAWLEQELADLEEKDKEWAKENGALFVGHL